VNPKQFTKLTDTAVPLMRANVDTDAIIPGDQLMILSKSGYGDGLFANWRYERPTNKNDRGEIKDFVLNQVPYKNASILLAGVNFACGSSREPAVWALRDYGFRCVIAPSYGHIFYANCFGNGILPVILAAEEVEAIAQRVLESDGEEKITVDLETQKVSISPGLEFHFKVAKNNRHMLLKGLDRIGATLAFKDQIDNFQKNDRSKRPWIYEGQETGISFYRELAK